MQSFEFFGKEIAVEFAKTKSDATARRDGSYKPRPKRKRDAEGTDDELVTKGPQPMDDDGEAEAPGAGEQQPPAQDEGEAEPNKTLFVRDLPAGCTEAMLNALFSQYPGFGSVRLIDSRHCAFVDYDNSYNSGVALKGLKGFKLSEGWELRVSFAKQ